MKQHEVDFNGKTYISSKHASEITGYTNDYIGQLARAEKINARMIGRTWFVETDSIIAHKQANKLKYQEDTNLPSPYKSKLPIIFQKKALQIATAFAVFSFIILGGAIITKTNTDSTAMLKSIPSTLAYATKTTGNEIQKTTNKLSTLSSELYNTTTNKIDKTYESVATTFSHAKNNLAQVFTPQPNNTTPLTYIKNTAHKVTSSIADGYTTLTQTTKDILFPQTPKLSASVNDSKPIGFFTNFTNIVKTKWNTWFGKTTTQNSTLTSSVEIPKNIQVPKIGTTTPQKTPTPIKQTIQRITINKPIQKVTIEKTIEHIISGVTKDDLETKIQQLNNKLTAQIAQVADTASSQNHSNFRAIALTNKIDNLSGVTISNATVNGISGLTDADIPNTITASNYLPLAGGTMTGTLSVNGPISFANITAPSVTTNKLYASSGDLYYNGSLVGGSSTGSWLLNGASAYYNAGNVGVGTSTPWRTFSVAGNSDLGVNALAGSFTATSTTATSTFTAGVNVGTGNGYFIGGTNVLNLNNGDIVVGIANISNSSSGTLPSSAFGYQNSALSFASSAFGFTNTASGISSIAFGFSNTSSGDSSSAFGSSNTSSGYSSSAFGSSNTSSDYGSSAFGFSNTSSGYGSSAFGSNITNNIAHSTMIGPSDTAKLTILSTGETKAPFFTATSTTATSTFAGGAVSAGPSGVDTTKSYYISGAKVLSMDGYNNTSVGSGNIVSPGSFLQISSSAFGVNNTSSGVTSNTFGYNNTASGDYSSAVGYKNITSDGVNGIGHSNAFGYINTASGDNSSAFGRSNTASGDGSSAFGNKNTTSAQSSSAFGNNITNNIANSTMIGPSDTAKLTILSTGNVGIGTTTPASRLSVAGFINTDQYSGYKQAGNTILYASSTNFSTLVGQGAGSALLSDGIKNTALGYQALNTATSSNNNTAVGYQSLTSNTVGLRNTAIGNQSLTANTVGIKNTAIGNNSLIANITGYGNTAVGGSSLFSNTVGYNNTAIGIGSLNTNATGNNNVGIGAQSSFHNNIGSANTVIGVKAGYGFYNDTYASSTLLGYRSGYNLTKGNSNILLGYQSGQNLTTGSNNIVLGYNIDAPSATSANTLNIGNLIYGTGVDGTGTTLSSGNVGIGTTTPYAKLSVVGNVVADSFVANSTTATSTFTAGVNVGTGNGYFIGGTNVLSYTSVGITVGGSNVSNSGVPTLYSLAFGYQNTASKIFASAFGYGNTASGINSSAFGFGNTASGLNSSVFGSNITNNIANSTMIGPSDTAKLTILSTGETQAPFFTATSTTATSTFAGGAVSAGPNGVNITSGNAYLYNGTKIAYGDIAKHNYFFGNSGNLTMTGTYNIANGGQSLAFNTSGDGNIATGNQTLFLNTTGNQNVAYGYNALFYNQSGSYNVAIGNSALHQNPSGSYNTALGYKSGYSVKGANNITIGANVDIPSVFGNQQLNIGNVLYGTGIYSGTTNSFVPVAGGRIGIGTTTPASKLEVTGDVLAGAATTLENGQIIISGKTNPLDRLLLGYDSTNNLGFVSAGESAVGWTNLILQGNGGNVGIGTTTPFSRLTVATGNIGAFNGAVCADNGGTTKCYGALTAGVVYGDSSSFVASDVAENYPLADNTINAGDIVMVSNKLSTQEENKRKDDTLNLNKKYKNNPPAGMIDSLSSSVTKADKKDIGKVIGIISTKPGVLLGDTTGLKLETKFKPVALSGRVPLKVNLEGGDIKKGDKITLSSTPGIGMRATTSTYTIATALQDFNSSDLTNGKSYGKILAFVNLGWSKLDPKVTDGKLADSNFWSINKTSGSIDFNGVNIKNINSISLGNWSLDSSGLLVVDKIKTNELCIGITCVDEAQLKTMLGGSGKTNGGKASTPPTIILRGSSTIKVTIGTSWLDPGPKKITDSTGKELKIGYKVSLDGGPQTDISSVSQKISGATTTGEHTLLYTATSTGLVGTATRTIEVINGGKASTVDSTTPAKPAKVVDITPPTITASSTSATSTVTITPPAFSTSTSTSTLATPTNGGKASTTASTTTPIIMASTTSATSTTSLVSSSSKK